MYKRSFFFGIVAFLVPAVFANPVSPMSMPLISEVFIQSPTQWYIELSISYAGLSEKVPCTTSAWRLRIASSNKTYNLQFPVDTTHMAVITRASITGIPETEQVQLASYDTISIMDTSTTYPLIWKFPLRPVAPGHSLYNNSSISYGGVPNPIETGKVSIGISGNLADKYNLPFISEVQVLDSAQWAIELDYKQSSLSQSIAFPCTLSQYRMQLANSATIYSVKAFFDTNGIAVLRPGNVFTESGVLRNLTFPTTIKILDTNWNTTLHSGLCWNFSIQQPLDSSHSLINGGQLQTKRVSIGKRTTYSTKYDLYFVNQSKASVSDVNVYYPKIETSYPYPSTSPISQECVRLYNVAYGPSVSFTINLDETPWYGFLQNQIPGTLCMNRTEFPGTIWAGRYIDSAVTKIDTIILPDPVTVSQNKVPQINTASKFYQVIRNNKQVLFSIIFPNKVANAQIKIFSLDGKSIATLPVGPISAAGTYSCEWNYRKSARPGVFLCTLLIDGTEMQSQKVKVW